MCKECEKLESRGPQERADFEEAKRTLNEVSEDFLKRLLDFDKALFAEQPISGPYAAAQAHATALGLILGKAPPKDMRGAAFIQAVEQIQQSMNIAMGDEGEMKVSVLQVDEATVEAANNPFAVRAPNQLIH